MARRGQQKGVFRHSLSVSRLLRKLPPALKDLKKDLQDYSGAFREMPPVLQKGVAQNIASEGASIGKSWKPNQREYVERKRKEGKSPRNLEYTRHLRAAILSGSGVFTRISKRKLSWGTRNLPYARAVHFGGKPFFELSARMKKKLKEIIDDHTIARLEKAAEELERYNGQ